MKVIVTAILICSMGISSTLKIGTYEFKAKDMLETLKLNMDKSFDYEFHDHMLHYSIQGNWSAINDSLILNSTPQKDRMIVKESKRLFTKNHYIVVTNKMGNAINYTINLFGDGGEEIIFKDQWKKTKVKANIKITSFIIQDTKGLKSPLYKVKGGNSNHFDVLFETNRVFEGEIWLIQDSQIIPNTISGHKANYQLIFKEDN
jgi:hypothetical protein